MPWQQGYSCANTSSRKTKKGKEKVTPKMLLLVLCSPVQSGKGEASVINVQTKP
ncbi:UNVERIFIED_CONTAM: hypothetical protein FKN15_063548 [Acipenser sinensis]